jgi:hypothetical protein
LMVDDGYRDKLLFPKMLCKLLSQYQVLGFNFLYSLSNRKDVARAHEAFGFREVGLLPIYARPYKLKAVFENYIKSKTIRFLVKPFLNLTEKLLCIEKVNINKVRIEYVQNFDTKIDHFINQLQSLMPTGINRNSEMMNWRTRNINGRKYDFILAKEQDNIVGYTILRHMRMKQYSVLAIVDILYNPSRKDVEKVLMGAIHNQSIEKGVDLCTCLLNKSSPFKKNFSRFGYLKTPELISVFVHEPKNSNIGITSKANFDKWHFSWIDHDSV